MLTLDIGTSSLSQGCAGQITVVRINRFEGEAPAVRAFEPPLAVARRPESSRR